MSSDWDEDIASWQADWKVDPAVLDGVVRRATGAGLSRNERIFEGHGSEVHGVATQAGHSVIVRIARRPGPLFDQERWPMTAAGRAGVPVPEVLLVEHTTLEGRPASISVQTRLPGRSLYRFADDLAHDDFARLMRRAGQLLGVIHGIEVPGPGPIAPDGSAAPTAPVDGSDTTRAVLDRTASLIDCGADPALVELAAQVVIDHAEDLTAYPLGLVHGDWRVTNVLSDGASITGVVDWEGAGGGDPARDLAVPWDLWSARGQTVSEAVLRGYSETRGSDDETFDLRRLVHRIGERHAAAIYYFSIERPDLVARCLAELRALLAEAGR